MIAEIALPLPLPAPLAYRVPEPLQPLAKVGVRVRVPAGKRRVVGWLVGFRDAAPAGVELRDVEAVLDLEPVLTGDLLELARFVADYYIAPLGEVLRSMLPADLPPWGDHRVWLTDAGAIAPPRSAEESAVVEVLRDQGRMTLAELQRRTGLAGIGHLLETLREDGRVALGDRRSRATRYVPAVELAPGPLPVLLAACGRSPAGQEVVRYLAALGRPVRLAELSAATGASAAVVRRLVRLGLLHQFSEAERLSLERHRMRGTERVPIVLSADQAAAVEALVGAVAAGEFSPFLLAGVTGAGKSEVFLRGAEATLAAGRAAILLVPEIALVPALAGEARQRFGGDLALLHSGLAEGERQQEWERIRRGEARVVLGPRSALFAPVERLGLVVVDEEQDLAYKQESTPRYNGRDLALVRGARSGAVVVLVSATPSLETRHNVERGKLRRLELRGRVGGATLPEGLLVDLRLEAPPGKAGTVYFSATLRAALAETFAAGDQAILLRNRRGYAPILLCRACGEDMRCDACGLPRTWHRRERRLICHYCGSSVAAPERCPSCGAAALDPIGAGTERIEEEFKALFPNVAVEVLDRDSVRRRGSVAAVLERFARGDAQALVGTQMASKGHHFPRVALTAVLQADAYLGFPDFRAVERTYTLLVQLAGRAGRGDRPGRVVVQTFHPEHYAIQAALRNDDAGFAAEEMRFRRLFNYPPYARMVQILARSRRRERAESTLGELAAKLAAHPDAAGIRVLGPAPAPFERLRGEWRFQLLLRGPSASQLNRLVREVLPAKAAADLTVDVDPQQLL